MLAIDAELSAFRDDIDGVDNAREVAKDGQEDVNPELGAKAHLQEYTKWRQQYRDDNANNVHIYFPV